MYIYVCMYIIIVDMSSCSTGVNIPHAVYSSLSKLPRITRRLSGIYAASSLRYQH
jgi:hypothetical protein